MALAAKWEAPMAALARAGRAFAGLEAVLGGEAFTLQVQFRDRSWKAWACIFVTVLEKPHA